MPDEVPLVLGLVLRELGAVVLPELVPGPQSFIAVLELRRLVPLLVLPLLELGLLLLDELGELEAVLPGPQSVLWPFMAPGVPALVPELVPVVLLVCAIAAVPNVNARIEAAARSRFICFSSLWCKTRPLGRCVANCRLACARSGLAGKSRGK